MNKSTRLGTICRLLVIVSAACFYGHAQTSSPLVLTKTIPLTGYEGGFDHFAYDVVRDRVFLAAEDHATVEVFDLSSGTHLRTLTGFEKPHSILVRPGASSVLVTDSGISKSQLIDASTYRRIRNLNLSPGSNCLIYDPQRNRVYVTAGGDRVHLKSSTLLAVNPDTGAVLKSVSLASIHLQPMAFDPATSRLFVNMPDRNAVAVLDGGSLRTIAEWKIDAGKGNSPIAFDGLHHRLFVVCSDSGVLVTLNSDTGAITSTIPVPSDADDMDFDPSSHLIYVPGGDGYLGLYDALDPDHIKQVTRVATQRGARTGLLIPARHRYVLAVPATKHDVAKILVFTTR